MKQTGKHLQPQREPGPLDRFNPKITFFPPSFQKDSSNSHGKVATQLDALANHGQTEDPFEQFPMTAKEHNPSQPAESPKAPPATRLPTMDSRYFGADIVDSSDPEDRTMHRGKSNNRGFHQDPEAKQYLTVSSREYNQLRQQAQLGYRLGLEVSPNHVPSFDLHDLGPHISTLPSHDPNHHPPVTGMYQQLRPSMPEEKDITDLLQSELRRFLQSRSEELNRVPPSPGKLRVNESKALEMKEAEVQVSNFYEFIMPRPASKNAPRLYYDDKAKTESFIKPQEIKQKIITGGTIKSREEKLTKPQKLKSQVEDLRVDTTKSKSKASLTMSKSNSSAAMMIQERTESGQFDIAAEDENNQDIQKTSSNGEIWVNISKVLSTGDPNDIRSVISGDSLSTNQPAAVPQSQTQQSKPSAASLAPMLYFHSLSSDFQQDKSAIVMQGKKLIHPIHEDIREWTLEQVRNGPHSPVKDRTSPILATSLAGNTLGYLQGMKEIVNVEKRLSKELNPYKIATKNLSDNIIQGEKIIIPATVAEDSHEPSILLEGSQLSAADEHPLLPSSQQHSTFSSPYRRNSRENSGGLSLQQPHSSKPAYQIIKEFTGDDHYDAYYQERYQTGDDLLGGGGVGHYDPTSPKASQIPLRINTTQSPPYSPNRSASAAVTFEKSTAGGSRPSSRLGPEESQISIKTPTYPSVTVPYQPQANKKLVLTKSLLPGATGDNRFHMADNPVPLHEAVHKYKLDEHDNEQTPLSLKSNAVASKDPSSAIRISAPPIALMTPAQQQFQEKVKQNNKIIISNDFYEMGRPMSSSASALKNKEPQSQTPTSPNFGVVISCTSSRKNSAESGQFNLNGTEASPQPVTTAMNVSVPLETIPSADTEGQDILMRTPVPFPRMEDSAQGSDQLSRYSLDSTNKSQQLQRQQQQQQQQQQHQYNPLMLTEDEEEDIERELRDMLAFETEEKKKRSSMTNLDDFDSFRPLSPSPKEIPLPMIDKHFMEKVNPKVYQQRFAAQQSPVHQNNSKKNRILDPIAKSASSPALSGPAATAAVTTMKNPFHQVRRKQVAYLPPLTMSATTSQLPTNSNTNTADNLQILANSLPTGPHHHGSAHSHHKLSKSLSGKK